MNVNVYEIRPVEGLTPQLANFFAIFNASKAKIIETVAGSSLGDLDYNIDESSNSVGTLLKHMAALEDLFRLYTFENRGFNNEEARFWEGALQGQLIKRLIKGNELDYYLELWASVRNKTYTCFRTQTDDWLYKPCMKMGNNYYCWFHVLEDHLCHLGQIKTILLRILAKKMAMNK